MDKILLIIALLCTVICVQAQDSCADLLEPCDGDPQEYECVKVTTQLTDTVGGNSSRLLQEYCFKLNSPLFQEMLVYVSDGSLDLSGIEVGDEIGEILFDVSISAFGEECPLGDNAILRAPFIVQANHGDALDLLVQFTEANAPATECILQYDPLSEENNNGKILEGHLAALKNGGMELLLELAELDENAVDPGLQMGDLDGTATPAPVYMKLLNVDNVYFLPPEGGELEIETEMIGTNESMAMISHSAIDTFDIEPTVVQVLFKRGDVNNDGGHDLADAISLLTHLFQEAPIPDCPDAADANDDGALDLADAITILSYLFTEGELALPGDECGGDVEDDEFPSCEYTHCQGG